MTPSMRFLVAWVAILAVVDAGYSLGWPSYLGGGSISLEAARLYRQYPWCRYAFVGASLILTLILDWHFLTYGDGSGGGQP